MEDLKHPGINLSICICSLESPTDIGMSSQIHFMATISSAKGEGRAAGRMGSREAGEATVAHRRGFQTSDVVGNCLPIGWIFYRILNYDNGN